VAHLQRAGWTVAALTRPGAKALDATHIERAYEYTGNTVEVIDAVQHFDPTAVFHLASLVVGTHSPAQVAGLVESNILLGTQLAEGMRLAGCTVLVNAATAWQNYAAAAPFDSPEYHPANLYAATKQAFEEILQFYVETAGFRVISLRLYDSYGPGDTRRKLIPLLLNAAGQGHPLRMSPGDQILDLVHVDDIAAAFLHAANLLLADPEPRMQAYAVPGGQRRTLREVAETLERSLGTRLSIQWSARPHRHREVMHPWDGPALPDWRARIPLEEGFARLKEEGRSTASTPEPKPPPIIHKGAPAMRLSLGIPAYNHGDFLRETVESALSQDVPFHEIVVSDNHSTDSTADVLRELQGAHPGRVRVVSPPQHLHMVANWNFTASQLTGDWFSLLSSDDVAYPDFVRRIGEGVALSKNAVLVRGAWRNITTNGSLRDDKYLLSVAPVTTPAKALYEQRFGPKGSFAAFALRRDIWEKVGGFPEEVTLIGDWGMWLLAGALGDTVYVDRIIAGYRVAHQSGTISRRQHIQLSEMLTIYRDILPRAAQMAGLGLPEWIAQASRQNFKEVLVRTSQEVPIHERRRFTEALRPWAEATEQQALLHRFETGEAFRGTNPTTVVKNFLRPLLTASRSIRRKG